MLSRIGITELLYNANGNVIGTSTSKIVWKYLLKQNIYVSHDSNWYVLQNAHTFSSKDRKITTIMENW